MATTRRFRLIEVDDAQLVHTSRLGGAEGRKAFGVLVQRHEKAVRAMLLSLCKDPHQADDLAQDAFIKAWQKLATLQAPEKFLAWTKQLAYRLFLHGWRRSGVEKRVLSQLNPEDAYELSVQPEVAELLQHCEPEEAEMLVMVYAFGFTIAELSQSSGVPEGTLKSNLHRVRKRLVEINQSQVNCSGAA